VDAERLLWADLAHYIGYLAGVLVLVAHHPVAVAVARERIILQANLVELVGAEEGRKDLLVEEGQLGVPVQLQVNGSLGVEEDALLEAARVELVVAQVDVQRGVGGPLKVK